MTEHNDGNDQGCNCGKASVHRLTSDPQGLGLSPGERERTGLETGMKEFGSRASLEREKGAASDEWSNSRVGKGAKEVRRTDVWPSSELIGAWTPFPDRLAGHADCRWRKSRLRFGCGFVSFRLVLFRLVSAAISHGPTRARDWRHRHRPCRLRIDACHITGILHSQP